MQVGTLEDWMLWRIQTKWSKLHTTAIGLAEKWPPKHIFNVWTTTDSTILLNALKN